MDALNISHINECATALEADLAELTAALEAKGAARSDFENGQRCALQVVFTHNDLLSGNVLIPLDYFDRECYDELKFIDYEYAGYNTRAFDIANHFCG